MRIRGVGIIRLVGTALILLGLVVPLWPRGAGAASIGLSVNGNRLQKDGRDFLPRGFNVIGLLAPAWCKAPQGAAARAHFGPDELAAAKSWNANTIRFQISQRGLADPAISPADRDAYLRAVQDGVALARDDGFVVILSMQDQSNGCGPAHPLPTSQTAAAWNVLAPAFSSDPYVMFELFNEPNNDDTADAWAQWQTGGAAPNLNKGDPAIGHQALVDAIRGLGASNVLVADGSNYAERLAGMPMLSDPTGNLAYGVHPYYFQPGPTWWDQQYGYLTAAHVVLATEWNYKGTECAGQKPVLAPGFLSYAREHGIGVLAHALDVPGTVVTNDWTWTPTDCATSQGGAGAVVRSYFAGQSDPPPADTAPPNAPGGLQAVARSAIRVHLNWSASSDNVGVTGYQILRDGTVVGESADPGFDDTDVQPETGYTYAVRAVDAAGNVSALSDPSAVTTPASGDTSAPSAPAGVQASAVSATQVTLSWSPATDDVGVVGYTVVRDGAEIAQTADTVYGDSGLTPRTTYRYVVRAVDAAGNVSADSAVVAVTTPAPPDITAPSAPGSVRASATSATQVSLSWSPSSDDVGVAGYQVVRDGTVVAAPTDTAYTDGGLTPSTTYRYVVRALDAAGNISADSAVAAVTTPAPPDTTPPSTPAKPTAQLLGPGRVTLSWPAATDNVGVTGYRVARDGTPLATVTGPSYTDPTAAAGTRTYTVQAVDAAGNVSAASPAVTAIVPAAAPNGLTGSYFGTASLTALKLTRTDPTVNFGWGTGSPAAKVPADNFSVRWTGKLIPVSTQPYTFYPASDNGVRLWVNGKLLVDDWTAHTLREDRATISLSADRAYDVKIEFYEKTGPATMKLQWSTPTLAKQVVPTGQLLAN